MGELLNFLVESILLEAAPIDKQIVVYSGRFQPFHKGHFATYQNLVKKFGSDSVYIGTSNVTDSKKSPFNFNEKKAIMMKMFGIPSSKIVNVKNPYAPSEILNKYNEDKTALIVVVGEKDENRLGGKYFTPYKGKVEEPYLVRGYVYASPSQSNPISGTDVRYWLSAGSEEERKKNFTKAYPKFDDQIFKMITLKLKKLKECINEEIKLNVKVGDTLLMGKFKNKKVLVKSIGEDEWGMPTINGKKAVTFRIPKKENLKEMGLGGGAGIGLSLPGGYINGAPKADDVKKVSKKLNNKGMSGYEKIGENADSDMIQCSKCDWEWKKSEGGKTPYTCHKCGNDNSNLYEIAVQIDKIPGGLANNKTTKDLANKYNVELSKIKEYLTKGIKVEMEHTSDIRYAAEIAMDHLWEDLKYYDKLATIENTIDEATSGVLDGTPTSGATFNTTWDDFDNQDYYLHSLEGWGLKYEKPSEIEKKQATDQTLPIDQQNDGKTHKYNRIQKYNLKSPSDFLKEGFTKGQLFAGKMKVGGRPVNVEVELVGSDNKTNQFITKIIFVDKGYERQLPIGSTLPIPARIFRTPGGGWRKIKTPSAFESTNEATSSEILKDLDKVKTDLLKKADVLIAKKKKLYSNVDIESPMSADEKKLDKDIADIFSQINQLVLQKRSLKKESVNESLLLEGGAYGHMNHPFDIEMNLTFGDLKSIVTKALNGDLELTREKTDGQALAVSWVNGRLVAARNKSHLKSKGAGAMTIGQVADKFAGRGGLTDAYNFAMQDLSKAIAALSEPQRKKIFKDGACFMNLEVIYPTSVNVIPYNQPLLVFHGTFEYDDAGTIVGENQQAASILGGMIKQVNAHVQSKYTIQGPPMTKLPKSEDLSKLQGKYLGMISKLQSEFGLSDNDGVADYHQAWWSKFVEKGGKKLDAQEKIGLVKRWAFNDKSFRIATIQDPKLRAWAEQTDKQDQQKISKQNLMRFEEIFLGVGADVLSFMESVLTANPDSAKRQMVARLQSTISQVKASGDPKKVEKLKLELQRLNALGGFNKIVPNEGIVFVYGGNTYKLTGAFAPLNQILGIFFDK
jgi:nicotinamide mononucleotide adenylyltransferase